MRQAVLTSALCLLTSAFANARVVRAAGKSRPDYWNGTYERIQARVPYALDPANPHNKDIADLTQPVEFSGDVDIARPKNGGNGVLYVYEIGRATSELQSRLHLVCRLLL